METNNCNSDHIKTIDKLLSEKQYEEAIELLNFYLSGEPSIYSCFSDIFIKYNLFTQALEILNKGLKVYPDNLEICKKLVELDFKLGHYTSAAEKLETIIKEEPDNPESFCLLGETYFFQKDFNQALKAFEKTYCIDESCKQVYFQFVRFYLACGDNENAKAWTKKAQETFSDDRDLLYRISSLYIHLDPLAEPLNPEDKIINILQKSLCYFPHNLKHFLELANQYFIQRNFFEALKNYNIVYEQAPELIENDSITCENFADSCYNVSENLKDEKIYKFYNLAFKKTPSIRLQYKLAFVLWGLSKYNQALEHLKNIMCSNEYQHLRPTEKLSCFLGLYLLLEKGKPYNEVSNIISNPSEIPKELLTEGKQSYLNALRVKIHNDIYPVCIINGARYIKGTSFTCYDKVIIGWGLIFILVILTGYVFSSLIFFPVSIFIFILYMFFFSRIQGFLRKLKEKL